MLSYGPSVGLDDPVILLDPRGRPAGTAPKRLVHSTDTPLHLGFSCHLVDGRGHVLVTRRAATKATWPGAWTNACCGHPQPGETLRAAVTRRLRDELGVTPRRMAMALPDFTYRAVMPNGVVEHEVCPVVVAETDEPLALNTTEVDAATWWEWEDLRHRARQEPGSLSPWSVAQIAQLGPVSPSGWFGRGSHRGLDTPTGLEPMPCAAGELHASLVPVRHLVDGVLADFLASRTARLLVVDPALAAVAHEIAELIGAGGKRLRPAFVYWGHRAAGADHEPAVAHVAAAVEMLHTFALLHDDVMDRALTRRGRAVAQQGFRGVHRAEGLGGDAEWFGTSAAILAGDLAFVWADELFDSAPFGHAALGRAREVFTTLRVEVMAGQYLDLRLDGPVADDPDAARHVALLKSGRYTVTRPLELGLALAGEGTAPGEAVRAALVEYGDAIGLAFQLRDDVLGLFGDPETTGKGAADDLRAGKRTLLVLRAMALATSRQRAELERCLGDRDLSDGEADRCREIVAASGALASVEALVRTLHAAAMEALAPVAEPARTALAALASLAAHRER